MFCPHCNLNTERQNNKCGNCFNSIANIVKENKKMETMQNQVAKSLVAQDQRHSKFKVFITEPTSTGGIPDELHLTINGFIALNKVAVKSVGVEFVESINKIIISLGYTEEQKYYSVVLQEVVLGDIPTDSTIIEQALTKACDGIDNIICHEFYVVGNIYTALFLKVGVEY